MLEVNSAFISEDMIETIEKRNSGDKDYPYSISVCLRNGKTFSVSYKNESRRNADAFSYAKAVEREKNKELDEILTSLINLKWTINRVDKRQLRIWRQLKALLNLEVDEEDI